MVVFYASRLNKNAVARLRQRHSVLYQIVSLNEIRTMATTHYTSTIMLSSGLKNHIWYNEISACAPKHVPITAPLPNTM